MLPPAFEVLFQAQVIFLGMQVKVSIIWTEHKKRDKRFFGELFFKNLKPSRFGIFVKT
jgi:hypothetical protein